jgi:hypothetical protein
MFFTRRQKKTKALVRGLSFLQLDDCQISDVLAGAKVDEDALDSSEDGSDELQHEKGQHDDQHAYRDVGDFGHKSSFCSIHYTSCFLCEYAM